MNKMVLSERLLCAAEQRTTESDLIGHCLQNLLQVRGGDICVHGRREYLDFDGFSGGAVFCYFKLSSGYIIRGVDMVINLYNI